MKTIFIKQNKVTLLLLIIVSTWIILSYNFITNRRNQLKTEIYFVTTTNAKSFEEWLKLRNDKAKKKEEFKFIEGYGEMGKAVTLDDNLPVKIQQKIKEGFAKNSFNQYVSDLISLHRSLPDVRHEWCTFPYQYNDILPRTSVIICFYNEAWSVLLRSVHSVLNRSPPNLLHEIILVDDFSDMDHLKKPLEDYWSEEPKVKIIRSKIREGLIRARLLGYKFATGEVLTYLDSHIEVTNGWLEPLLDRIAKNYTTVTCPVIDSIDFNTFEYQYSKDITYVGGFDWNLLFTWHKLPEREVSKRVNEAEPVPSPTMAGGLFSISKKYFKELGTYDEGFDVWGGENLELSFKIWMCGGSLEIVPCSRVGHIFRDTFPYKTSTSLSKNLKRLAEVWLDEYKRYYYQRSGESDKFFGDVTDRLELRKKLECKSFKWYLDNIYPELYVPDKVQGYGMIFMNYSCIDSWAKGSDIYKPVKVFKCYFKSNGGGQFWYYGQNNDIRKEDYCLHYNGDIKLGVTLYPCENGSNKQQWIYQRDTGLFVHSFTHNCLRVSDNYIDLEIKTCNARDKNQIWHIENLAIIS